MDKSVLKREKAEGAGGEGVGGGGLGGIVHFLQTSMFGKDLLLK